VFVRWTLDESEYRRFNRLLFSYTLTLSMSNGNLSNELQSSPSYGEKEHSDSVPPLKIGSAVGISYDNTALEQTGKFQVGTE
jgi:hypothetical protein